MKYFTQKNIGIEQHYCDPAGENGYDWDNDGRYDEIGDRERVDGGMISINDMREILNQLEKDGANYVRVGYHCDHNEVEIEGVNYKPSTQEEIDEHLETVRILEDAKKQARIAQLEAEIDKLKSK